MDELFLVVNDPLVLMGDLFSGVNDLLVLMDKGKCGVLFLIDLCLI